MPSITIIRKSTYVASSNGSDDKKGNQQKGISFQQHISLLALIFYEKQFGEKVPNTYFVCSAVTSCCQAIKVASFETFSDSVGGGYFLDELVN